MKPRLVPTEIVLRDLPPEGREFLYNSEGGELNSALDDLIGKNPYEVRIHVSPMGNTFNLRGTVKTNLNLECSLCGIDMKFPVNQTLNELLVLEKNPMNKGDHLTKANHAHEWVSDGPDYLMLDSDVFEVGNYIHEVVGLAEPIRPLGKPDCDLSCENLPAEAKKYIIPEGASAQDSIKANPFQILEKMKLKS